MIKTLLSYVGPIFFLLLMFSCGDGGCNVIPNVSFNVNINRGEHQAVYAPGGWAYAKGGACGLIVYNTGSGLVAYDRCSTVADKKQVVVNGFVVEDKATGAKWLLLDGSPSAIAECPLKPYRVSQQGDIYYVSN